MAVTKLGRDQLGYNPYLRHLTFRRVTKLISAVKDAQSTIVLKMAVGTSILSHQRQACV